MKIMNRLTVKKLKEALKDVPDDLEVKLWSDSGVDQCDYGDCEAIIEDAYRYRDNCFVIYANWENK